MQQTLVRGDLGIYANPEAHILLEFRRVNEGIRRLGARGEVVEERREQEHERRCLD